jgi:IS30 family transposase
MTSEERAFVYALIRAKCSVKDIQKHVPIHRNTISKIKKQLNVQTRRKRNSANNNGYVKAG